jgi:hypothetical protein
MEQTDVKRRRRRAPVSLLIAVSSALSTLALQPPVRAYSSFADYTRPIEEGGGGGRLFTGTPADAYGCEVCHRGAQAAPLDVLGLPLDGYVPGQAYEILLQWPTTVPHVALMAEFTDTQGNPVGVTALAPYATWSPGELCEDSGFPAADLCRSGVDSGCCRELEPTRDACSFPGERAVLWLLDCGSRSARVVWTAPLDAGTDVWFSSVMVSSDVQNDALGDGVTSVLHRLRASGKPAELTAATGTCQLVLGSKADLPSSLWWVALMLLAGLRRIARRGIGTIQPRHRTVSSVESRA